MVKTLYMLIGPKGSGKTYIGTLIGQRTAIHFLSVEPIWLALQPGEDGWQTVAALIDDLFVQYDNVMIESLGAGEPFQQFYAELANRYAVNMIRVHADLDTCLERVRNRNRANHIPVPEEQVAAYNKIAAAVEYDWAAEIDNNGPATEDAILAVIYNLLPNL